ncbi:MULTISPECIES: aromatic aminobenezylarsenical efflux permease ArsG family transporter [Aminobacterium]|jgi:cytochrome c biogenesis protein CcdA|uniref:aromatic aminobenezylarsenical efflux permease ArsG family transporter n=1 Tax=Aminobacterium TaxID=81466 RepID=UPI00257D96D5|nr:aromatic aminobenezylarsenical efflux permease ArsG family transporter [Aminobacterium sp. UBA4987]
MIWTVFLSALWLGILTAISPCPLTMNIAAVSFIGRKAGQKNHVIGSGILYSAGRTIAYVILGVVITTSMLGRAEISSFLQKYMNEALGPILIILGLVLLGWLGSSITLHVGAEKLQEKATKGGVLWAFPIGFLFALSFCPVSAGLFFGGLLPLALKQQSSIMLPVVYGIGTSLPVVIFAFLMAFGSAYVGKAFNRLTQIEIWVRRMAGTAFILTGIYYSLTYIYGILV